MHRQVRAESIARKYRTGILLFEAGPFGTIADDDFASRPVIFRKASMFFSMATRPT